MKAHLGGGQRLPLHVEAPLRSLEQLGGARPRLLQRARGALVGGAQLLRREALKLALQLARRARRHELLHHVGAPLEPPPHAARRLILRFRLRRAGGRRGRRRRRHGLLLHGALRLRGRHGRR